MAMVAIAGGMWLNPGLNWSVNAPTITGNATAARLQSSGNCHIAQILRMPKAGTLAKFHFRTGSMLNNPDNGLRCSFQDLDGDNEPDFAQDHFRDLVVSPYVANTWYEPGLMTDDGTDTGAKRTVTKGQRIACVVSFTNFVSGDDIFLSVLSVGANATAFALEPFGYSMRSTNGTSWGAANYLDPMIIALEYDDGTFPMMSDPRYLPLSNVTSHLVSTASSPDELGLKFTVPYDCVLDAASVRGSFVNGATVELYDASSTLLESVALADQANGGASSAQTLVTFATPHTLTANATYRLVIKATTTSNLSLFSFAFPDADFFGTQHSPTSWCLTGRTDAGSWTDTATSKIPFALRITEIDTGSGGGGGGGTGGAFTFIG